jgi:outer membrane receptor protein involved in Fe transport
MNISSNGGRQVANTFLLDGVDANNIHSNTAEQNGVGSNGVPVPSTEVLQEFKVQTGQYDAQYGRNAGASINVVTKSGTNQFHGSLFEYFRNDVLNANNFFLNSTGTKRPVLRQNQFGATLGGPIQKDKTFFFFGYQGTRQINGASTSSSNASLVLPQIPQVRTRATLGAAFGGLAGAAGAGTNNQNTVAPDGSNINPVAIALLNVKLANGNYMIPSPQTTGSGVNYTASIPARYTETQFTLNLDHQFSSRQKLGLRLFGANVPQIVPLSGSTAAPGFPLFQDFKNRNASMTHTWTINPATVNEARVGYSRPAGSSVLGDPTSIQAVGINRVNSDTITALPQITVSGAFSLGYGNSSDQKTIPNTFTYNDTLSWTHHSHFIRTGFEARRYQTNLFNRIVRGSMTFLNFQDFLLGMPGGANGNGTTTSNLNQVSLSSGITDRNYRTTDLSAFLQDDWKLTPKLTFNLGIRYDFMGFQYDTRGRSGNYDLRLYQAPPAGGSTSAGFVQPKGTAYPVPGLPQVDRTFLDNPDNGNFAPRLGLAYRILPKLVLRSGYGIFWERVSNQMALQLISNLPFVTTVSGSGAAISTATFQNPFANLPAISSFPITPAIYAPPYSANRPASGVTVLDPGITTPYLQQYSLNLQYEFPGQMLLEVGYVGSKGTHLPWTRNVNPSILASPTNPVNGETTNTTTNAINRVRYPGFSNTGFTQVQTGADSNYNSLQTSVTKRLSHGLQFLASYTWAKSIDDGSGSSGSTLSGISGDPTDTKQARGLSDFDRRHRFTFSYVYGIPAWGFGLNDSAFGQKFFSGWQVSGVTTVQTGSPINITDSRGASLFGSTASRASWAPGATVETATLSGSTEDRLRQYFNTAAFVSAGTLWGDTGRNILTGPGQSNIDVSLTKMTPFMESRSIEWRVEVFNALNHPNFGNPSGALSTPSTFGQIRTVVANARLIQFGLRIVY